MPFRNWRKFKRVALLVLTVSAVSIGYTNCGSYKSMSTTSHKSDLQSRSSSNLVSKISISMVSGVKSPQLPSVLIDQDNSASSDIWDNYITFTPTSSQLEAIFDVTLSEIDATQNLRLDLNFKEDSISKPVYKFEIKNQNSSVWESIGESNSLDNKWSLITIFKAAPLSAFLINGNQIQLRMTSSGSEIAKLDFLGISQSSTLNTEPNPAETPNPTPTATPKPSPTPLPTMTPIPKPTMTPTPKPTMTPTPQPTMTPTPQPTSMPSQGSYKKPPAGKIGWDWQIGTTTESNITLPEGVVLLDLDGFNTSAAKVAQFKAKGVYMVCYINAGSWQPGYPDSADYPSYLKIQKDPDWPEEFFLDVRDVFKTNSVLAEILRKRFQMCKDKGFDAIEPDNLQNDENAKGKITLQEQIDFNGFIADIAHKIGIAILQKNGPDKVLLKDRTGKMMVDKFDGILNEECQAYNECGPLAEYVKRGKMALNTEYKKAADCKLSDSLMINTIQKDLNLKGGLDAGYKRVNCK